MGQYINRPVRYQFWKAKTTGEPDGRWSWYGCTRVTDKTKAFHISKLERICNCIWFWRSTRR